MVNEPVKRTVTSRRQNGADFDYFWFIINDTVSNYNAAFEYQISVGSFNTNSNPDLYISVMDGRSPTDYDFDFSSN